MGVGSWGGGVAKKLVKGKVEGIELSLVEGCRRYVVRVWLCHTSSTFNRMGMDVIKMLSWGHCTVI